MKEFSTDEYLTIKGKGEFAVGIWQYEELPKVGETIKIDNVPLEVKGVERYTGKKTAIKI